MSTKIIYHQIRTGIDCPDGITSAHIVRKVYPDSEVIGCVYQGELPEVKEGDRLIIVDFSFPADVIKSWSEQGVEVLCIDHHKTALEALTCFDVSHLSGRIEHEVGKFKFVFDIKECGATLTWKYFFPNEPMPPFLEYIRDRDLWDFLLPKSEEIHEAVASMRRSFALFDMLSLMSREDLLKFVAPVGEKLLKPKREKIANAASRYEWENVAGYVVPVVRLNPDGSEDRLTSDICMKLYRELQSAPFVACITSDGSYSLRSDKHKPDGGFDVGALAKSLGGGGHQNSSAYRPTPSISTH